MICRGADKILSARRAGDGHLRALTPTKADSVKMSLIVVVQNGIGASLIMDIEDSESLLHAVGYLFEGGIFKSMQKSN